MGTCICSCGAKYRFAEEASGKQVICKKCGEPLTLVDGVRSNDSSYAPTIESATPSPTPDIPTPIIEVESEETQGEMLLRQRAENGYWSALFWSLLFPSSIQNLAAFLTLWGFFGFLSCIPLGKISLVYVISMFWIAVGCWYAAFLMGVLEAAANGQFQLPDVNITADVWADLLEPAIRWYGSWFLILIPALFYSTIQGYRGVNVIWETWQSFTNPPLIGVPGPVADPMLLALAIVGFFFWPLTVTVVVLGGFGNLWRIDRILFTIGNTLAPYLITVIVVAAAYAIYILNQLFLSPPVSGIWQAQTTSGLGRWFLHRVLAAGIDLYATIVAARAIGLYFRHYGHRFAWDWGQN